MKLRGLKDENSREIFASFKLFFHLPSSAFLSVQQNQTISQFVNIFLLKDIRRKKKDKKATKDIPFVPAQQTSCEISSRRKPTLEVLHRR